METILRRGFEAEDRQRVENEAIASATANSDSHLSDYKRHPNSYGGRYVATDLFKETFPAFRNSREARNRYNVPVHNAAAVLASEQLRRLLDEAPTADARTALLLTGVPGAGKTTSVLASNTFPEGHRAVYEGQLARPETAFQKIEQALRRGYGVAIAVAHASPADALRNTLHRFAHDGRGASIGTTTEIQATLPTTLETVRERYSNDEVAFLIFDNRDRANSHILVGWNHLPILRSEGHRESIEQQLRTELERQWRGGLISVEAFRQAHGAAPLGPYLGLGKTGPGEHEADEARSGIPPGNRAAAFAHLRPSEALKRHPELAGSYNALNAVTSPENSIPLREQHRVLATAQARLYDEINRGLTHRLDARGRGPTIDIGDTSR